MTREEAVEEAAKEMFAQHHGPKVARYRTWESVGEREHIYWRTKADIGVRHGMQVDQ